MDTYAYSFYLIKYILIANITPYYTGYIPHLLTDIFV